MIEKEEIYNKRKLFYEIASESFGLDGTPLFEYMKIIALDRIAKILDDIHKELKKSNEHRN